MAEGQHDGAASHDRSRPDEGDSRRILWELSVAAAGVGTFDWDLTSGRLTWDERLIELFGYHRGEFDESIDAFNARLHPEDLPDVTARLQAAIATAGDYEATYRVVAPGEPVRWVTARGRALTDPDGTTARVLGAAWDTSAHHEAAAEVAGIVEDLAVGFFALDDDWVLTHVNAATERIAGLHRADVLGRSYWEVFPAAVGSRFERAYRTAVADREVVTFEAHYPEPLDVWVEVRAVPTASGLSVYFLDVTEHHLAAERAVAAARRASLLSRITEELLSNDDPEDAAARLAALVVPALADWAIVSLVDDAASVGRRRGLRTASAVHADPQLQPVLDAYAAARLSALRDDALVVRTMETALGQRLDGGASAAVLAMLEPGPAREAMALLAPEHVATHPLTGRGGTVGMLTLARGAARGAFAAEDHATAVHVAARAGVVLDNARLYRQQRDLAEGLQRSLLTAPPQTDHLQVAVRYSPAAAVAQVGGDWYDAFLLDDGAAVLVIGDVVGHDIAAAAAMSQVRTLVRGIGVATGAGPAELLTAVDRAMQALAVDTTATAVVARIEPTSGAHRPGGARLVWSSAGHPPPLLITPDRVVTTLEGGAGADDTSCGDPGGAATDLLLGVEPAEVRHDREVGVGPGATVLLYTDGLVERRGQSLDTGLALLRDVVQDLADEGVGLDGLCDEVLARMLPAHPEDDVALVAVRLRTNTSNGS